MVVTWKEVWGCPAPEVIKMATIAHRFAPPDTAPRIIAQNYLLENGLSWIVDANNAEVRAEEGK